jgi:dTDP-L-rhamnose 4-epimerase
VRPGARTQESAQAGLWEPICPQCLGPSRWTETSEADAPRPLSVYGATKLYGEIVLGLTASKFMPPVTCLRFFNLYGSRQSPANPYVGVASTFAALALAGKRLTIFEDGEVLRDFLHVSDAVAAIGRALDRTEPLDGIVNVGSGTALSLLDLARHIAAMAGESLESLGYDINGKTRAGALRACVADIGRASRELGWQPQVALDDGLAELLAYIEGAPMIDPAAATAELEQRGLLIGRR